jgi:predicted dehydrogenase
MAYRAAVIGCGRIGCSFDDDPRRPFISTHAGAYSHIGDVELVALADVDASRLAHYGDKFGVSGRYQDYREMLQRERPDLVSICTRADTHCQITERAACSGVRAIFCEKPLADSLASADAMIEICKRAGVLLLVNHQRRFDRFHQQLAAFVREGGLGKVRQVTSYYTAGVANTGTHLFDLLASFLGEVESVTAVFSSRDSPNPGDPNLDGWLRFRGGAQAAIQAMDVRDYTIFETNILGSCGRLRLMAHGFKAQLETVIESPQFSGYQELGPADLPIDAKGVGELMLQAIAHIVDCLRNGKRPVSSGEDGRRALEIICALHESANSGGTRVMLPLRSDSVSIQSR